jgi:alpha-D-ribose 1-methylphosphonate 5-triphosphate diphosphatase
MKRRENGMNWVLTGAEVLDGQGLRRADLAISGSLIAGDEAPDARRVDLAGLWLLPGIVDLHGDAIERIIMPRPGVSFPLDLSLIEADRQMLANGITTAFHGLTIGWEPGLRSIASARDFVASLLGLRSQLSCDTRVNFRWEVFALDEAAEVMGWFKDFPGAILSLNDHTTVNLGLPAEARKIRRMADRTGLSPEECVAQLAVVAERAAEVPLAVDRMVAAAHAAGLACLAHDEMSPEERARHRILGVGVSEFPMTRETALAARAANEPVVFGAPNVLRGGSQNNAVDAGPAMAEGIGTVLASDYWYPAPLHAAFRLVDDYGMSVGAAWACVSANPAAAAGLTDRGRLTPGQRADILAVCPRTRRVQAVWVAGERKLSLV